MKAILKFSLADVRDEDKKTGHTEDSLSEIEWFEKEHQTYYGTPSGRTEVGRDEYSEFRAGAMHACEKAYSFEVDPLREKVLSVFSVDIDDFEEVGGWLTSRGNFTLILRGEEHVLVLLDGRRHGVRTPYYALKEKATWEYIESQLPHDAHPYDTREMYEEIKN